MANILIDSDRSQGHAENTLKHAQMDPEALLIDLEILFYQIYSVTVGYTSKEAAGSASRGAELASHLLASAAIDLKIARSAIEASLRADLISYFEGKGLSFPPGFLDSLVSAEMAGGLFAKRNMPERLRRGLAGLTQTDAARMAAEIAILNLSRKKDFNYIRYTVNAVNSVFGNLQKRNLFEIPKLSTFERNKLEKEREQLLARTFSTFEQVDSWLEDVISIHYEISNFWEEEVDSEGIASTDLMKAKKKKGFVSTKSLSTYRLRVKEYAECEALKLFPSPKAMLPSDVFSRIEKYKNYKPLSIREIQKQIQNNHLKIEKLSMEFEQEYHSVKAQELDSNNAISTKVELDKGKILSVKYSGEQINKQLIRPIINSLRSQLILSESASSYEAVASNDDSQLSVEIGHLKKSDLEKIEIFLLGLAR